MAVFVITNSARMKINASVKNLLIKVCVIRDLFGILLTVSVNVTHLVILVSI